ncbi:MAG TPA: CHASE3 domain-containing protein [Terriglobales bacterium]|nr:CHASE3 domain-containing protein [Terriglobales bacterium]
MLVAIGIVAYRTTNNLVESERLIAHTHEVQTILEDLRSDTLRATNSRRGFIITNDENALRGYYASVKEIPPELEQLRRETADNPARSAEIDHLKGLSDRYLSGLQASIDLRKSGKPDLQPQIDMTNETAVIGDEIRLSLQTMREDEAHLLDERSRAAHRLYDRTMGTLAIAFVAALLLLGAEFFLLNREFTKHQRTERIARHNRELLNAFFSSSTVGFGILDDKLRYQRVNDQLVQMVGLQAADFLGRSVIEIFPSNADRAEAVLNEVIRTGEAVLGREVSGELPGKPGDLRHWLVNYFPIKDEQNSVFQIGIIALDVTDRRSAEQAIRRLSARLLTLQDQERRRIAREIHDSLGQYLAAIKINLHVIETTVSERGREPLAECVDLLDRAISETRTLSHLLHPPLLDEAGFSSAANWFVSGFSQRSGIPVTLELPPDLRRLPNTTEIALFRVLQESLTNVHRHSQSASAEIKLQTDAEWVTLKITDRGRGIDPELLRKMRLDGTHTGVGLAGMRERIRELGGKLEINSDSSGTTIEAAVPAVPLEDDTLGSHAPLS